MIKACREGDLNTVKELVEQGVNIHAHEDDPVLSAVYYGHLDVVKYLVEQGVDIHSENDCALLWAAKGLHLDVVKYLVEQGANVHAADVYVLRWASDYGHVSTFIYLSSFYDKQQVYSILSKEQHSNLECFYLLMHFFFYQEHTEQHWDGNIGLIVASLTWS